MVRDPVRAKRATARKLSSAKSRGNHLTTRGFRAGRQAAMTAVVISVNVQIPGPMFSSFTCVSSCLQMHSKMSSLQKGSVVLPKGMMNGSRITLWNVRLALLFS